ncbi:BTB/POZ domain-containing protein 6-like [Dreissena polymorpha]|nr:BTB/POZ domain-containing protein 6-like [Dreissena polymorpha]
MGSGGREFEWKRRLQRDEGDKNLQHERSLAETNAYMLKNQLASDVTLVVGATARELPAHKYMLASRSQVFYAMFFGELPEAGPEVIIPDIDYDVMMAYLRFLYTDSVEITPDLVMGLMYCGKKYDSENLVDLCLTYLQEEINPSNVCTIMEQAHLFDETQLWENCLASVFSNATDVLTNESRDFVHLCRECLTKVVKDDRLVVEEEYVYIACKQWAIQQCRSVSMDESDDKNIRTVLGDILYYIRFPLMEKDSFNKLVSVNDILTTTEMQDVYQTYSRSSKDGDHRQSTKPVFLTTKRILSQEFRAVRFRDIKGGIFDFWENENHMESISFKCSRAVQLRGVTIFAPFPDGLIRGSVNIFDATNTALAKCDNVEVTSQPEKKTHDLRFKSPVTIREGCWYTVTQKMIGSKSYFGTDGLTIVPGKGVTFQFRKSPMFENNTDADSGHIHGLIYT